MEETMNGVQTAETAGATESAGAENSTQTQNNGTQTFDDMLKQFMADSDSKISSIKQYSDHRTKSKRRQ